MKSCLADLLWERWLWYREMKFLLHVPPSEDRKKIKEKSSIKIKLKRLCYLRASVTSISTTWIPSSDRSLHCNPVLKRHVRKSGRQKPNT